MPDPALSSPYLNYKFAAEAAPAFLPSQMRARILFPGRKEARKSWQRWCWLSCLLLPQGQSLQQTGTSSSSSSLPVLSSCLPAPRKPHHQSSPHLASIAENEVPAGQRLPPEEDSWGVDRRLPARPKRPLWGGSRESVFLCPEALHHPVPLRLSLGPQKSQVGVQEAPSSKKASESLAKPHPSAVPFGATCWRSMAFFHIGVRLA